MMDSRFSTRSPEPPPLAKGFKVRGISEDKFMKHLGIRLIGALFGTVLSGAALAQTAGGTSSGGGSTSGTAAPGSATPGSVSPGLPSRTLPLPSTAPAPAQRSTTGIIENQQMLDRSSDQPSTIQSDRANPQASDMPAGGGTVTLPRQDAGGTATGRASRVRDSSDISNRRTAVIGPGQLSFPAAMERRLPITP
jgi:hypothetical protein